MVANLEQLRFRPFGSKVEDLEIPFGAATPPQLVTDILTACVETVEKVSAGPSLFWSMTVGDRIAALLTLVAFEVGSELTVALQCSHPSCGKQFEAVLDIQRLLDAHRDAMKTPPGVVTVDSVDHVFRRPTGHDQHRWSGLDYSSTDVVQREVLSTLLVEPGVVDQSTLFKGSLDIVELDEIEQGLQQVDPLVSLELELECPFCGTVAMYVVDLQAACLNRLERMQRALLRTIHQLATHYHWTEAEIMAIPPRRRAKYLALIKGDQET